MSLLETARVSPWLSDEERSAALRNLILVLAYRVVPIAKLCEGERLTLETLTTLNAIGTPRSHGGPGVVEDAARLIRLVSEAGILDRLPVPVPGDDLLRLAEVMEAVSTGDFSSLAETAERLQRSSSPLPGPLRGVLDASVQLMSTSIARPPADGPGDPGAPMDTDTMLQFLAMVSLLAPDSFDEQEREKILGRLSLGDSPQSSRMVSVMLHMATGMRTRDRDRFRTALRLLQEAAKSGELDSPREAEWLHATMAVLLMVASMTGGSLLDEEAGTALLESFTPDSSSIDPHLVGMRVCTACLRFRMRLTAAQERRDVAAVDSLIEEILELDYDVPGVDSWVGAFVSYVLGTAHLTRAFLTHELSDIRKAVVHLEEALEVPQNIPVFSALLDASWAPLLTLTALLESDPDLITEGVRRTRAVLGRPHLTFNFEAKVREAVATALAALHRITGDMGALDEAVVELEHARKTLPPEGTPDSAALHWDLATLRATRAATRPGTPEETEDLLAAVTAARDSLRAAADDVLLQLGVRHGLRVARKGADRGRTAASWALRVGRVDEAIACLEAGRSLVLSAAAESRSVADRLEALGAADLAAHWREAAPTSPLLPQEASASPADLLSAMIGGDSGLPGDLRRRALDLLRGQEEPADESPAETAAALRTGVARAGVDALVYLLPGTAAEDGAVLMVTPDGPARAVPLAALSEEGRVPVVEFLKARTERQQLIEAPFDAVSPQERRRAERRWREAFDQLCAWAGGVLAPVLETLGLWERALAESGLLPGPKGSGPAPEPVRLVLVPCGDLGVVPWPAAVLHPPAGQQGPESVRACEIAVISHAASGREFLRASSRARMHPQERPALVYHGDDQLEWAEDEVERLREVYYPGAEYYSDDEDTADAPATPMTVLSLLGGRAEAPASLLHLSCHGIAGPDPTTSALVLAPSAEADGAEETDQQLTLTSLLETPHDGEAYRSRGPLVVCGACETDLTTSDHDEALTVTSVLVHRLAADAIGARWLVDDDESEILMLVLHDRVAAGMAPPDALRAAQCWMLTEPDRRFPVRALEKVPVRRWHKEFRDTDTWAAFVHHGNPSGGTRP
ncbi:CHAT domain-containing protein [Streptomyces thermovulgaris]|uniref:CHAT domain-containing protein n=1 Tax=Streptomyces thermovulgaris TaxID=1934 RepID=UPI001302A8D7|nr:CHAT domain-containing protein [Streptomyces thermovulgaris]